MLLCIQLVLCICGFCVCGFIQPCIMILEEKKSSRFQNPAKLEFVKCGCYIRSVYIVSATIHTALCCTCGYLHSIYIVSTTIYVVSITTHIVRALCLQLYTQHLHCVYKYTTAFILYSVLVVVRMTRGGGTDVQDTCTYYFRLYKRLCIRGVVFEPPLPHIEE